MPLWCGASGLVAREADAPVGLARKRGPDLLTLQRPAAVDLGRLGTQRGEVGAGAGLGEQLAPGDVADAASGATKRSRCSSLPCSMIVGTAQLPITRSGGRTPAFASSSAIASCSTGRRGEAVRLGPVRGDEPGIGERHATRLGLVRKRGRAPRAPGWRSGSASAPIAMLRWRRRPSRPSAVTRAFHDAVPPHSARSGHRTAQREVGVVLPREADAAEDLDAVLGVVDRVLHRDRAGSGGRDCELAAVVRRSSPRDRRRRRHAPHPRRRRRRARCGRACRRTGA